MLGRHGLQPKRSYSQNFLVSRSVVDRVVQAVAPAPEELVVELGPGLGTLTGALLHAGSRVLAVESDPRMLRVLEEELGRWQGLELVAGDARTVDLDQVARRERGPIAIAGNLPYAVTGTILRNLVVQRQHVSRAVLMVQKEVRDRLLASPGTKEYGALTVFVSAVFQVEPVVTVRPGSFHPPPKVASAVVRLRPLDPSRARLDPVFTRVVRSLFDARRKTVRNALRQAFPLEAVDAALGRLGIEPGCRGETLEVETMDALARTLEPGS